MCNGKGGQEPMISEKSQRDHEMIRNHIIGTVPRNGRGSIVYSIGRVIAKGIKSDANQRAPESNR